MSKLKRERSKAQDKTKILQTEVKMGVSQWVDTLKGPRKYKSKPTAFRKARAKTREVKQEMKGHVMEKRKVSPPRPPGRPAARPPGYVHCCCRVPQKQQISAIRTHSADSSFTV